MHNIINKNLRVSVVIPVYNEAAHLAACLDAISRQTIRPYEVIVVDNNSSDNTADIASSYPFVRLLSEKRQGVVYARDRGFDAARGDIIGRIDADTIMSDDWVASVMEILQDGSIDAVTGSATYHDIALAPLFNQIDLCLRSYMAWVLRENVAMQGANMAFRRSVWRTVRREVCRSSGMHEDLDLTIHVARHGYKVIFAKTMRASLAFRQIESRYLDFAEYVMLNPKTYALHGLSCRRHMYPVVVLALLTYVPVKFFHDGFDARTGKFSWDRLMIRTTSRVNPATYVD